MTDPRICIIGAGNLSTRRIYPNIGASGGRLVGVCDLDRAKAETNSARFGGTAYADPDAMLDTEKPDAVVVCVSPEVHPVLAIKVMKRGIPVYTEKPPALKAADAVEVAKVARETGMLCVTAFKKRYSTAFVRAREWIGTFKPEDRYSLSAAYASAQYANRDEKGSFLLDFTIHMIDLVLYLYGDVDSVFAFSRGMDAYAVSLKFACGAVGSLDLNDGRSFSIPTETMEISIRGSNFMTIRNSSSWRIVADGKATEWREPPTFTSQGDSGNDTGHLAELADFVGAVREGRKTSRSSIFESVKSMALYEAIRKSAESGTVVRVQYPVV